MKCPNCGSGEHQVLRTKAEDAAIERTRECLSCGKRFKTVEAPAKLFDRASEIAEAFEMMKRTVGEE